MKLWMALYAMIWISFLEFLFVMTPTPDGTLLVALHIVVGVVILGLAYYNFDQLRKTRVPGRVKRTAKATFSLAIVMAILGILIYARIGSDWIIPVLNLSILGILLFLHVVNAFAIITQAAATSIAFDMWEDKEFAQETEPGVVPAPPAPKTPAALPKP